MHSFGVCSVGLLAFLCVLSESAKPPPVYPLPPYIKRACLRNDPKLNECVVEMGAPALKSVTKGDTKYKIPKLDPLEITELRVKQGTDQVGLNLIVKKCQMWGLKDTTFYKADVDLDNNKCTWFFTLDKMKITGKYNVSGRVLLLPIVGSGDIEMLLEDMKFQYKYDWRNTKKSNGMTYVILDNSTFPFEVGNMKIKLENLFNGDPLLGGNMNRFINENWRDIMKDLNPALSKSLAQLTKSFIQNMANVVPLEVMFPTK